MNDLDFKIKYIKYKLKYLQLKQNKQSGGMLTKKEKNLTDIENENIQKFQVIKKSIIDNSHLEHMDEYELLEQFNKDVNKNIDFYKESMLKREEMLDEELEAAAELLPDLYMEYNCDMFINILQEVIHYYDDKLSFELHSDYRDFYENFDLYLNSFIFILKNIQHNMYLKHFLDNNSREVWFENVTNDSELENLYYLLESLSDENIQGTPYNRINNFKNSKYEQLIREEAAAELAELEEAADEEAADEEAAAGQAVEEARHQQTLARIRAESQAKAQAQAEEKAAAEARVAAAAAEARVAAAAAEAKAVAAEAEVRAAAAAAQADLAAAEEEKPANEVIDDIEKALDSLERTRGQGNVPDEAMRFVPNAQILSPLERPDLEATIRRGPPTTIPQGPHTTIPRGPHTGKPTTLRQGRDQLSPEPFQRSPEPVQRSPSSSPLNGGTLSEINRDTYGNPDNIDLWIWYNYINKYVVNWDLFHDYMEGYRVDIDVKKEFTKMITLPRKNGLLIMSIAAFKQTIKENILREANNDGMLFDANTYIYPEKINARVDHGFPYTPWVEHSNSVNPTIRNVKLKDHFYGDGFYDIPEKAVNECKKVCELFTNFFEETKVAEDVEYKFSITEGSEWNLQIKIKSNNVDILLSRLGVKQLSSHIYNIIRDPSVPSIFSPILQITTDQGLIGNICKDLFKLKTIGDKWQLFTHFNNLAGEAEAESPEPKLWATHDIINLYDSYKYGNDIIKKNFIMFFNSGHVNNLIKTSYYLILKDYSGMVLNFYSDFIKVILFYKFQLSWLRKVSSLTEIVFNKALNDYRKEYTTHMNTSLTDTPVTDTPNTLLDFLNQSAKSNNNLQPLHTIIDLILEQSPKSDRDNISNLKEIFQINKGDTFGSDTIKKLNDYKKYIIENYVLSKGNNRNMMRQHIQRRKALIEIHYLSEQLVKGNKVEYALIPIDPDFSIFDFIFKDKVLKDLEAIRPGTVMLYYNMVHIVNSHPILQEIFNILWYVVSQIKYYLLSSVKHRPPPEQPTQDPENFVNDYYKNKDIKETVYMEISTALEKYNTSRETKIFHVQIKDVIDLLKELYDDDEVIIHMQNLERKASDPSEEQVKQWKNKRMEHIMKIILPFKNEMYNKIMNTRISVNYKSKFDAAKKKIFNRYYEDKYMWNSHIKDFENKKAYFYTFDIETTLMNIMEKETEEHKVIMNQLFTHINNIISSNHNFSRDHEATKSISYSIHTMYSDFTINLYFAINIYFNGDLPVFNGTLPIEYRNILDGLNLNLINKDLITRYTTLHSFFDKGSLYHDQNKLTETPEEWDRKGGIFYKFLETLEVEEGITNFLDYYKKNEHKDKINKELKSLIEVLYSVEEE